MGKLISVIIPIYNVELYLNRCMESIVNQTYKNLEIIMVDDGSPDNCPELCEEWGKRDSRIKVIHKKNGGLSDARNMGLSVATGEYIAFVDSDDFVDLDMYRYMIDALEKNGADISTCGRFSYRNGEVSQKHISANEVVLTPIQAIDELLRGGLIEEAAWDKIYRKNLFDGIVFPVGEINEDLPIMPHLFERANKIVCTGKPFYHYCENPGSITHEAYNEKKRIVIKHIEEVSSFIENKYPELKEAVGEFQGRYASGFLILFEQQPELKGKYPKDYQFYRFYCKRNWRILWNSKNRTKKQKIEMVLALWGIYRPIWKMKHHMTEKRLRVISDEGRN